MTNAVNVIIIPSIKPAKTISKKYGLPNSKPIILYNCVIMNIVLPYKRLDNKSSLSKNFLIK